MTNLEELSEALNINGDARANVTVAKCKLKDISPVERTSASSLLPTHLELDAMESREVYKATMTPVYSGHIPRANLEVGRTFTVEKVSAVHKFIIEQETIHAKQERQIRNTPTKLQVTNALAFTRRASLPPKSSAWNDATVQQRHSQVMMNQY